MLSYFHKFFIPGFHFLDNEYFCFKLVKVFLPVCLRTCVFSVSACVVGDYDDDVVSLSL